MRRLLPVLLALCAVAACSGDDGGTAASSSTTPTIAAPTTIPAVPTTTAPPAPPTTVVDGTVPGEGEVRAVVTPTGVLLPVLAPDAGGFRVQTPCGGEAVVGGTPLFGATVVLDPGHGGAETGAVGANGLVERDLNLAVAIRTKELLESKGASVVLTRTGDYRVALPTRAAIITRLQPRVFVSIHHNGGSDGPSDKPGTETYYQIASGDSKRLAGLVYEELLPALSRYPVAWQSDLDAGAKYRPASDGGDYYGMLRRTAGVPGTLSEALFLSNPPEAELLARPDVQQDEARALTRAVVRYLTTADPGSGFVEPYPRTDPAGPGGGVEGCVDPPL